jgi:uncharacterized protein (DUF302 family)
MKRLILFTAGAIFAGNVLAQMPMQRQPTKEELQAAMMQQMQMMAVMFEYRKSRLGFDETVAAIAASATKRGWAVGQAHDMQAAMKQSGVSDAKRMKVLSACPKETNERLAKASQGKLPPLPCRITVFEGKDGKAYVVRMNTTLLARALKDEPAKVMAEIAAEEAATLKDIVE